MADRLVQLIDKDDDKIYPKFIFDDYILYDETTEDSQLVADMTGATASANGKHGLAPQPNAGDQNKTLTGGGVWEYPLGTVLAYKEWTNDLSTNGSGSLTAISTAPNVNWGPCTASGSGTNIVVPSGESWGVLVECCGEVHIGASGDYWVGPGIKYSRDGGSDVSWASAIWTNRGNTAGDQYNSMICQRYGLLTSGTWNFKACTVSSNSTYCTFIGNKNQDYARGPSYTFTIRLVDRIKS